jgi:hypothetical protein
MLDAGIVLVFLPLLALGVNGFVSAIATPEEPEAFNSGTKRALANRESEQALARGEAAGGNTGKSAPEVFMKGLENLGNDPMGWMSGVPSALTSTLAPELPARQMGAKERARMEGRAPAGAPAAAGGDDDYFEQLRAEYREKNLMGGVVPAKPDGSQTVAPGADREML